MERADQRAPLQEHFDQLDQSVYRNESGSDVSESFTICTDACYTRYVSGMLFYCACEETIKNTRTVLQIHTLAVSSQLAMSGDCVFANFFCAPVYFCNVLDMQRCQELLFFVYFVSCHLEDEGVSCLFT